MSLEEKVASLELCVIRLTEAVNRNSEALTGKIDKVVPTATGDGTRTETAAEKKKRLAAEAAAKEADKKPESKHTVEDIAKLAVTIRDTLGTDVAKALIKKHGGSDLAKLKASAEVWDAFVEDADAALAAGDEPGDDGDGL